MIDKKYSGKVKPDDIVHEIDGIVELNHPAPVWWQTIYYISIVWAIAYASFYLTGNGRSIRESLVADLAQLENGKTVAVISPEVEREELRKVYRSPEGLASGRAIFTKNCATCHAPDGGGGIGPNLTDVSWIHGDGSIDSILKVVREGVAEKGMPPWGPILKREETLSVVAFVRSLRGNAPGKPKVAQGTVITYSEEL